MPTTRLRGPFARRPDQPGPARPAPDRADPDRAADGRADPDRAASGRAAPDRAAGGRRPRTRVLLGSLLSVVLAGGLLVAGGAPAGAAANPVPSVPFSGPPESPSPHQGQVSCDPVEKPGATALRELLRVTYGKANTAGSARSCSVGGASEHKEGRAYDWMMNAYSSSDKAAADAFVAWLTGRDSAGVLGGNAHRLGIQYVIWNRRTWQSWTGAWKTYTGASPHTDHVHVSFSWDGAMKRTSWWTGRTVTNRDIGPCQLYVGEAVPPYSRPNYGSCPAPVPRGLLAVTGDFNGDRRTDVGSYSGGRFVLRTSSGTTSFPFGRAGDVPVVGDWDGNGVDGVGVFRNGQWYLRDSLSAGAAQRTFAFGTRGDRPVAGAWQGGASGIGVVRGNQWHLRTAASAGPASASFSWGRASDAPVVGDWYGSGADSVGVLRSGTFLQAATATASGPVRSVVFGHRDGAPAVGDWNGDRVTTPGTARGTEHLLTDDPAGRNARVSTIPR